MNFRENLTLDDFKDMHHLEAKYYDESHITPYQEAYRWYLAFPWSNAALYEQGKLVGFLDLFPVDEDLYFKIAEGEFSDADLKAEDMIDIGTPQKGVLHMFLCCIVIDEAYRKTDALKLLLQKQVDFYKPFIENGLQIEKIITDNVTQAGDRFSTRLGFSKHRESTHGSTINVGDYADFTRRIEGL